MKARSPKDDRAYVHDLLESARLADNYLQGLTLVQFLDDPRTQDAVVLRLTMIDDFAQKLAPATVANMPAGSIQQARSLRSRMAHPDGRVDFPTVWNIAQQELQPLAVALEKYLLAQEPP
ncbi:MAG: DUF86 domain-containing protein [Opitutae bacterium]|nr:DUF86 domain-containing protein [Opitutae bacterium]